MKKNLENEHDLQNAIIEWLQYKNFYVMRLTTTGTPNLMAFKNVEKLASPAHRLIVDTIKLIFIEVKLPKKKTIIAQANMMSELEKHGAKCFAVHSLEELEKLMKEVMGI